MSRTTSRMPHLACGCNKLTSVRKLISAGASDTVTDGWGNTPLHQAAVYASGDVVRDTGSWCPCDSHGEDKQKCSSVQDYKGVFF